MPPNGMAQRQRRDWRDSFSIIHHFWQTAPARSGRAAVRLEPVLGRQALIHIAYLQSGSSCDDGFT
jgi:hypothetical protein